MLRFEHVSLSYGSQQILDFAAKCLCNEGDVVAVENPAFLGAFNAFRSSGARLAGVPMEDDGVNLAALEAGELEALGEALDQAEAALDELHRESCLATAQDWGLERTASLFRRRPIAATPKAMREALAALLRIGGDSFTLDAINDTISGCGVNARVRETGKAGTVEVSFPKVPGIPPGFDEIQKIVEDILPAHLLVQYHFWYLTWAQLESKFSCWQEIEDKALTWTGLETYVEPEDGSG